jgi:hypothetical protein
MRQGELAAEAQAATRAAAPHLDDEVGLDVLNCADELVDHSNLSIVTWKCQMGQWEGEGGGGGNGVRQAGTVQAGECVSWCAARLARVVQRAPTECLAAPIDTQTTSPVATTTPIPWPADTVVALNAMHLRSPRPDSAGTDLRFLLMGTDSPVGQEFKRGKKRQGEQVRSVRARP